MLKKSLCLGLVCTLSTNAMAMMISHYNIRPFMTATGSYAVISPEGQSNQYQFSDGSIFNLNASRAYAHQGLVGIFIGGEYQLQPEVALQLGLSYYQPGSFTYTGNLAQGILDSPATFSFYNYKYEVSLRQLLVEAKALYSWRTIYHPFVSLGLGASFNSAWNYQVNNPEFLTFTPQFASGTTSNFSYRVGLGVDIDATDNLRFGIGYHFANFGQANLGAGHIDTTGIPGTLKINDTYTNELVAQITLLV